MDAAALRQALGHFPRLDNVSLPTPLQPLPSFSGNSGPQLWLKRDDEIGPGLGGNKGRKLAYLMAEVLAQGKRRVITYGGLQSNHAQMTAAACAALGLDAHLFFFERRPDKLTGNLLLDRLFGAKLHFIPFGGGGDATLTLEMTNRLVRLISAVLVGPRSYFMPVGGHTVTGCLGYVEAALEIHEQVLAQGWAPERVTVVTAAGTGGTLAGLLAGFTLLDSPLQVLGLDIGKLWKGFPASLARLAAALCQALGQPHDFTPQMVPLIEARFAGPGYGRLDQATTAAIQQLAQQSGVILDPVYSGKAFAGLLALLEDGRFGPDDYVIFLHTGGLPGLWAYETELAERWLNEPPIIASGKARKSV